MSKQLKRRKKRARRKEYIKRQKEKVRKLTSGKKS